MNCLLTDRYVDGDGYANVRVHGRKVALHRAVYEVWHGPIPQGFEIDHLCCVPSCFEPTHLDAVTHDENMRRRRLRRTSCRNGHAYDWDNTYVEAKGSKVCRACRAAYAREYRKLEKK